MGLITTRKLESVRFDAGNPVPYKIQSSRVAYSLALTLSGAITCTNVNNTAANTLRGDEWGLIRRIQLKTDKEVWNVSGDELFFLNRHWFGKNPNVSVALGNNTVANPAFSSTLVMPFYLPRSERGQDTLINFGRFDNPELTITWGNFTDVNSTATGFTTTPTLRVQIKEDEGRQQESFWARNVLRRELDVVGATPNAYFPLSIDRTYRRIFLNTRNNASPPRDTGTILNNVRLYSGTKVYYDAPFFDDREATDLMTASPDQFERGTGVGSYARIRQNDNGGTFNHIDGWHTLDLSLDGSLKSAPDTYGFSQFGMDLDVAAAGRIIAIEESVEVPRARAV